MGFRRLRLVRDDKINISYLILYILKNSKKPLSSEQISEILERLNQMLYYRYGENLIDYSKEAVENALARLNSKALALKVQKHKYIFGVKSKMAYYMISKAKGFLIRNLTFAEAKSIFRE